MLKTAASIAILISLVLSFSMPAFAWDETGHKIVAYIAWQQMTPEVREKVFRILHSAPEDSQLSTYYDFYAPRSTEAKKREFFMLAAIWPETRHLLARVRPVVDVLASKGQQGGCRSVFP